MKTLKEISKGVLIGFGICMVPVIALYATGITDIRGSNAGTALALLVIPILFFFFGSIIILQIIASLLFVFKKRPYIAFGIWTFLPTVMAIIMLYAQYLN